MFLRVRRALELQRSSLLPYYHDLIFIAGKPPGPEVKRREFVALSARLDGKKGAVHDGGSLICRKSYR
jgi:hypothetical protein